MTTSDGSHADSHDLPSHYHDPADRRYLRNLRTGAPAATEAFMAFDNAALRDESRVIPRKYTELMALAVALTTQCGYCIEGHVTAARDQGATEQEVAETVFVAAALRAGGALSHGMMALKFFNNSSD